MHLWDRLLPQAVLTLNMLRKCHINPLLSAATYMEGQFDFNKTPLAPPGTRIVAYETPSRRATWAPHGVDGYYIGHAPEHYRCYKVYITKTRCERTVETVEFFLEDNPLPFLSSQDVATEAAQRLTHALMNPAPAGPFSQVGDEQQAALKKLAAIFEAALPEHKRISITPPWRLG